MSRQYITVARVGELKPDTMKRILVDGRRLLLVHANGRYHAVDEMCSHEESSLYLGCVQDGRIKCSLHGSRFDLTSGEALDEPADAPIGVHAVRIDGDEIQVALCD